MPGLVILFIAIVAAVIVFSAVQAAKRRKELADAAMRMGMTYAQHDPFGLPNKHADMLAFGKGHSKKAYNTLYGEKNGLFTVVTDYQYTEGSGKNSHTYYKTYCIIDTDKRFAQLQARPENFLDTIASWVGFDDIDFEYKEFNDAFYVRCRDKKFAYDIIHAKMMEYLLRHRGLHFEMAGRSVLAHYDKTIRPVEYPALISSAQGIIGLLPTYM